MKFLSLIFTLLCSFVFSQASDNQIVVRLNSEHALLPVYLAPLEQENNPLPPEYVKELWEALRFDLDHNGMTKVLENTKEREGYFKAYQKSPTKDMQQWKALGPFYVISMQQKGSELHTTILSTNSGESSKAPSLNLSGSLSQDRREVHALSDSIHKTLFGKAGIATTRILYTVSSPNSTKERPLSDVWVADYDGKNAKKLTYEQALCVTPSFIPPAPGFRSGNFFFVSYRLGQPKIFLSSLNGESPQRFSSIRGNQLMPQSSLQRSHVAFICDAGGNPDIFLQDFDPQQGPKGKPRQIFAAPYSTQASPVFSPDGKHIAFVSNKDGRPRVYTLDVPKNGLIYDVPKATLISRESRENTSPSWSPDGTKIAYSAKTDGIRQIWLYDFALKRERQLTSGPGNKENPSWAPNSLHLVFNSAEGNESDLYLINLHEKGATKLTSGPGSKRFPSWEPLF